MRIQAVAFPFDLFGSAGTGAGAQLLADALRELLADTRRETRPARADAFRDRVRVKEFVFETLAECEGWRIAMGTLSGPDWHDNRCAGDRFRLICGTGERAI